MTDDQVEIDVTELSAHGQRLDGVADRVRVAHDAARVPMPKDAFGAFGVFLARECDRAAADGLDTLADAHAAAVAHRTNVGDWARDVDTRESEIMTWFSTAPEMRGD